MSWCITGAFDSWEESKLNVRNDVTASTIHKNLGRSRGNVTWEMERQQSAFLLDIVNNCRDEEFGC